MDYSSLLNSFMEFLNVKEWVLTLVPYLLLFFLPSFLEFLTESHVTHKFKDISGYII